MKQLEQFFKALGDTNRLRILNLLLHGELCVCDIQYVLNSSQPNVSRHLIYLKNSGLVLDRREGPRMYYRLSQPSEGMRRLLFTFLQAAFKDDAAFKEDRENLKKAIGTGACTVSEYIPFSGLLNSHTTSKNRM